MKINRTVAAVVAVFAVGGTVSGCSGDSDDGTATATTSVEMSDVLTPTTTDVTTTEMTTATPAPDVAGKVVVRGADSSCVSNASSAGPVDLVGVDVHIGVPAYAGDAARVTWKLSGPLPTTGTVLLSFMGASQDGSTIGQLGYKIQDGQQVGYFVFDYDAGSQSNLDGMPDTSTANEVSGVMPSSFVDALGTNWHWSAALSVDGRDVDSCPS